MNEITDKQIEQAPKELAAERKIMTILRKLTPEKRYRGFRMVLAYYGYL